MKHYYQRIFFEREALNYDIGKKMHTRLKNEGLQIEFLQSHNRVTGIPGKNPREAFFQGKNTLVIGVRRTLDFATCKPSAHFQLPLVTGCGGLCEYCYLNTQMGKKPYTRVYVNIEEILKITSELIEQRKPEVTLFEAAATSDPLPVEPYSGSLQTAINFFAGQEFGRLRFVTKFNNIDSILPLDHKGHTRIRFSINTERAIHNYEHRTPPLADRLDALARILEQGYPGGVIVAPVFLEANWQEDYRNLLQQMRKRIPSTLDEHLDFEIISHRFTARARSTILDVFPDTDLPMDDGENRKFKYGQFGYGKYVYTPDKLSEMKVFFEHQISDLFPKAHVNYII